MKNVYKKLNNIFSLLDKKGIKLIDDEKNSKVQNKNISEKSFMDIMEKSNFIIFKGHNKETEMIYYVILLKPEKKNSFTKNKMKSIVTSIKEKKFEFIIISKHKLYSFVNNYINLLKDNDGIITKKYLYRHFIMKLDEGPFCSKHRKLSSEEIKSLKIDKRKLPVISSKDPQLIFFDLNEYDVIEIEAKSFLCAQQCEYRLVRENI